MNEELKLFGIKMSKALEVCRSSIVLCKLRSLKLALDRRKHEKRQLLKSLVELVNQSFDELNPLINELLSSLGEALKASYGKSKVLEAIAVTESRLLIHARNIISSIPFEIGTIFHPVFGVPYIPASSLKGCLRSYLSSLSDISETDVDELLGTTSSLSKVIITDALPIAKNKRGRLIEPDVMTPIYKDSVKEHEARPVPVIYPVIAEGVIFKFFIAVKDEKWLRALRSRIPEALKEGVGGKTLVSYGIVEVKWDERRANSA